MRGYVLTIIIFIFLSALSINNAKAHMMGNEEMSGSSGEMNGGGMQSDGMDMKMNGMDMKMDMKMKGMCEEMMGGMKEKTGDEFDREFLSEMIKHHQSAIEMSQKIRNTTQRPAIRNLADNIITSQSKEIEQMRSWLNEWYGNSNSQY